MAISISGYYTEELTDWKRVIAFYEEEIHEFDSKFSDVIRRNTIPDLASRVEYFSSKMDSVSKKFYALEREFQQQELKLKADHTPVEDHLITMDIESRQNQLRKKMQENEKEYIGIKHDCNNFLSSLFKH